MGWGGSASYNGVQADPGLTRERLAKIGATKDGYLL